MSLEASLHRHKRISYFFLKKEREKKKGKRFSSKPVVQLINAVRSRHKVARKVLSATPIAHSVCSAPPSPLKIHSVRFFFVIPQRFEFARKIYTSLGSFFFGPLCMCFSFEIYLFFFGGTEGRGKVCFANEWFADRYACVFTSGRVSFLVWLSLW